MSTSLGLSIDELLAERDYVRRLAEGLLFDAHEVDDVVQQTWLAALKRPPANADNVRGWLGQVVRNRVFDLRRKAARRRRHEVLATTDRPDVDDDAESADTILAREDERQRVVTALRGLAEPYRTVVALRYFEQLQPSEIAARRGVPATTVRTQLKRGLDMMRQRLDAEHGGDGKAWMLAIAPLWRGEHGLATGASASGLTAAAGGLGGLVLLKKALLFTAPLLLLAAGFWLTRDGYATPELPEDPLQTASAMAAEPGAASTPTAVAPARQVEPGSAPDPSTDRPDATIAAAMARVVGRILQPNGEPVAHGSVRALGLDGTRMFTAPEDRYAGLEGAVLERAATTEDDGRFELTGIWPRAAYVLRVEAAPRSMVVRMAGSPGPGETLDVGDLKLPEGGVVRGTVTAADGQPLAGAEVSIAAIPALVAGVVRLHEFTPEHGGILMLPRMETLDAKPRPPGASIERYFAATLFQKIGIEPGDDYDALVLDGPDWVPAAWRMLPMHRTRTAADGTFELAGLPTGRATLVATHPDMVGATRAVGIRIDKPRQVKVRLRPGTALLGRVLDAAGRPRADAEVRVAGLGRSPSFGLVTCRAPVRTAGDGGFRVPHLESGRVLVAARGSSSSPWTVIGPLPTDEPAELRLARSHPVRLSVRTTHGKPVALRSLELFEGADLRELRGLGLQRAIEPRGRAGRDPVEWLRSLEADRPGSYALELVEGVYTVRLTAAGCAPLTTTIRVPHEGEIDLRVEAATDVVVRVVDPQGKPVADATVRAVCPRGFDASLLPTDYGLPMWNSLPTASGRTDADGRARFEHLPVGLGPNPELSIYGTLFADHPAFGTGSVDIETAEPGELTIRLPATATLRGRLADGAQPGPGVGGG